VAEDFDDPPAVDGADLGRVCEAPLLQAGFYRDLRAEGKACLLL